MANLSCPPTPTVVQYEKVSSLESLSPLTYSSSSAEITHPLITDTVKFSSSDAPSLCSSLSTRPPQTTLTSLGINPPNLSTVLSSGLPVLTTNLSQTYRYSTATPSASTYVSKSARNNIDALWTFVLSIVLITAVLRGDA